MSLELWQLAPLGKKAASGISPGSREPILDFLYSSKDRLATTENISTATGLPLSQTRRELMRFVKQGLVSKLNQR